MIDKTEAGKRITILRKKLGYSQGTFAEKLNVSTQAVSKWETGLALPDIEILLNISWMCKASINSILEGEEDSINDIPGIDRGLQRLNKLLMCPQCKAGLKLNLEKGPEKLFYECEYGHKYDVIDGVVFFSTREIPGELWSLWLRNYDHYLEEQRHPGNPRYMQGEVPAKEVKWREMEKCHPRVILDVASGTGSGIKYMIERINWPCTIIMTDLSHRILKWNNKFFSEELKNPYVDIVYLACDCSNLPIFDSSIDVVTSTGGFESMQLKMMDGFREAYRVLKQGASAIYGISIVDDHESENTKKWIELYTRLVPSTPIDMCMLNDISHWKDQCKNTGFAHTDVIKIYGEMPAPKDNIFPFENEVLQWMGEYVVVSQK
jgi:ubiquinone/menaquinone biosynthesis C-methylase UbiE/DNA-binding XRE family transcriptional regulator